ADSVATALEAQAATMANADNTNRNTRQRETPVARKCSYKEFMSCQPFNFKGTKGVVGLIRWFERTESVFLCSNCIEDCKVKFATGTLTEEALSWWNSFAQPIGIEEAYKITWNYRNKGPATGSNLLPVSITCHACGEKGHYKSQCSRANNNAHRRAYLLRDKNAHQDPNVVTAQVMEKKLDEKRLEDIPVVREFPKVFPEILPGLPPVRQVEFQIDLMPGAAPVARALYKLAPS
ncbi:reverse transcriptase domain-containing protein, partial [Tanacetum coccineum]